MEKARLVFSDGQVFEGEVFASTSSGESHGEVVFNTAMTGYQEILTDPSYNGQMVLMTYPLIGSYGINDEDMESRKIFLEAFLVKEYVDTHSNWRSKKSLKTFLEEQNVLGVQGLDTRAITKYLRESGAKKVLLTTSREPLPALLERVQSIKEMSGSNLVNHVTCTEPYTWKEPFKVKYRVAVIDCGVKHNILEMLRQVGCLCRVFPATTTTADQILSGKFDGVFISNGPGDPGPVTEVIELIKNFIGKIPLFGICLGHQLLSMALGGKTYKLKFGHHGANHPIMDLRNRKVEITSQNHGFAVDPESIPRDEIEVTHINLNDNTVAGIRHKKSGSFSVQYHPEAAPGPQDSQYFFEDFIQLMAKSKL